VVLLVAVLAAALWPAAVHAQTGSVRGIIRDGEGMPLARAVVTIRDDVSGSQHVVTTDDLGTYRIENLEPRGYVVEAARAGARAERRIFLRPGEALVLDLVAVAPPGGIQLPQSGTLYALVIVTLLGLLITQSGTQILKKIGAAGRWVGQKLYQFLAPRFPERIGVPGYRTRFLRSSNARIEIPVGPQLDVPIQTAFVPLRLMGTDRDERVDAFPFVAAQNRLMVLGGPGSGKSTLMKNLAVSILRRRSDPALNDRIPVFVVLRDLARANHSVEAAIVAALGHPDVGFTKAGAFVSAALASGRLLIVLDGLDEVGVNRAAVAARIREFCQADDAREKRNHVIVTCREASYTTRDLSDVLKAETRIEPFTPQHMRQFLQAWPPHRGKSALALYADIQADPQVRDTCRNPLLLTILAGLYLEKDRFDLPSSRDQFYDVALKEHLDERPARRGQEQRFGTRDKLRVLQRASLDRLETADEKEDPELLIRDRVVAIAKEVLNPDTKPDLEAFITELVKVNGIVRFQTENEDSLVFGHRTFQEYLAAREASETRDPDLVVAYFSRTPERAEVLYFYCGLIRNVLQIREILLKLGKEADPAISGRALLSVTEPPAAELVEPITARLLERIETESDYHRQLEILTSLAQRRSPEFQSARRDLALIVDRIIAPASGTSAAALSTLSGDPELAMSLVPALLAHPVVNSRVAAVQLLYDIGSVDALDELVRLLQHKDTDVRDAAAVAVCNLLKSRHPELRRSAALLPARADAARWPFEDAMPGRLVLPILDILKPVPELMLGGIRNPLMLEAAYQDRADGRDDRARAQWRRAATDRRRSDLIRGMFSRALSCLQPVAVTAAVAVVALQLWAHYREVIILAQPASPWVTSVNGSAMVRFYSSATTAYQAVREQYPPERPGLWRVVPAAWLQPSVPAGADGAWDYLRRRTQGASNPGRIRAEGLPDFDALRLAPPLGAELPLSAREVLAAIPEPRSRIQIWFSPARSWAEGLLPLVILTYFAVMLWGFRKMRVLPALPPAVQAFVVDRRAWPGVVLLALAAPEAPLGNAANGMSGIGWVFIPLVAVMALCLVLTIVRLPRNRYIRLVDDSLPAIPVADETATVVVPQGV
jgi:hypothetical protein